MIVSHDLNVLSMIVNASIVVKFVMAILLAAAGHGAEASSANVFLVGDGEIALSLILTSRCPRAPPVTPRSPPHPPPPAGDAAGAGGRGAARGVTRGSAEEASEMRRW